MRKNRILAIRLNDEEMGMIEALATQLERSRSDAVRFLVRRAAVVTPIAETNKDSFSPRTQSPQRVGGK